MVTIWMPVYNEARDVRKTIDSVLNQTFEDFDLIISNNHSTDDSEGLIRDAIRSDPRVRLISPPRPVKGMEHVRYLWEHVLPSCRREYSIFIGGHDLWQANLLETLLGRAKIEQEAGIVFTDSFEIDPDDRITRKWGGIFQTTDLPRHLIVSYVLLGLTHNIIWGGLWNEKYRLKIPLRYDCSGNDHLLIAEMALHAKLVYQPGSIVYLRQSPRYLEGIKGYVDKHVDICLGKSKILDFVRQLHWVVELVNKSVSGDQFYSQPAMHDLLASSAISNYLLRYWPNMLGFDGAIEEFFSNEDVKNFLAAESGAVIHIKNFLSKS